MAATLWGILCPPPRQERWHGGKSWKGWQEQGDPIRDRKLARGQWQRGTFTSVERGERAKEKLRQLEECRPRHHPSSPQRWQGRGAIEGQ